MIEHGLMKEHDCVVVVCADQTGVGEGKSTLAMLCCAYVAKKLGKKFTPEFIIFDTMEYRLIEQKLKPMSCLQFDEAIDVFFSREAMTRDQRSMTMKFAKIRQQSHFIVLCIPTILMLSKWFRGTGQTRTNAIFRCLKRGVYKAYGKGSGSINRVKVDTANNEVKWPRADFTGRWKKLNKTHPFFKAYLQKKNKYLKLADENPKVIKAITKEKKRLQNTFTIRDMSEIKQVNAQTIHTWLRMGFFAPSGVFKDLTGKVRVKEKAFYAGIKRIEKWKQTNRIPAYALRNQKLAEKEAKRLKKKKIKKPRGKKKPSKR